MPRSDMARSLPASVVHDGPRGLAERPCGRLDEAREVLGRPNVISEQIQRLAAGKVSMGASGGLALRVEGLRLAMGEPTRARPCERRVIRARHTRTRLTRQRRTSCRELNDPTIARAWPSRADGVTRILSRSMAVKGQEYAFGRPWLDGSAPKTPSEANHKISDII
jgi:hypothetical protein